MYKFFLPFLFLFTLSYHFSHAQNFEAVNVFESGEGGYKSYRIPAIITSPNGDLLAFVEGRVNGVSDFGHIHIVMKRSTDGGKTWSALQVVATNGEFQAGNPAPVVDLLDPAYPQGRIFIFYNKGNKPTHELFKGLGSREAWYKTSTDNGYTWSDEKNITDQVKKNDWYYFDNTPGHALQFHSGKYKGRIYVASSHAIKGDDFTSHGYYTDDHGESFHMSESVCFPGGETTATTLSNDGLMLNIRNESEKPPYRVVAVSRSGGEKWDKVYYDYQLPDPSCEGSILNLGTIGGKDILAFSNNADTSKRINLTLRISRDSGETWEWSQLVDSKAQTTIYSDLVKLNDHQIGILYEAFYDRKDYSIMFSIFDWREMIK